MKRILCFIIAAIMLLAAVSCDSSKIEESTQGAESTAGATVPSQSEESEASSETIAPSAEESEDESEKATELASDTEASETETETDTETETESMEDDEMIYPEKDEVIVLANDEVYGWWEGYNMVKTDSTPFYRHEDIYYPNPVTFTWPEKENADYYRVYLSTDENFEADKTEKYLVNTNSLTLSHLFTGTKYYWQVIYTEMGSDGDSNFQLVAPRSFSTAESPRCLEIEGVSNTRDIGGIIAQNGYRIKQGMIYRGGKLENITDEGKAFFLNYVGIKTDLDLRTPGEGGAGGKSPLGSDINYVNIDGRYYVGSKGITTEQGKELFAQEIRLFADPDNYPIYIHCSLGRDRTGTLAFVIEGLLGVNKNRLIMDYELSVFSVTGTADNASISAIKNNILETYNYINSCSGKSFQEKTENYLLSIGITEEEIQTIKDLLLEEVK